VVSVSRGMEYLINAVTLEPVEDAEGPDPAEWRTLWASLTFEVPRLESAP